MTKKSIDGINRKSFSNRWAEKLQKSYDRDIVAKHVAKFDISERKNPRNTFIGGLVIGIVVGAFIATLIIAIYIDINFL